MTKKSKYLIIGILLDIVLIVFTFIAAALWLGGECSDFIMEPGTHPCSFLETVVYALLDTIVIIIRFCYFALPVLIFLPLIGYRHGNKLDNARSPNV